MLRWNRTRAWRVMGNDDGSGSVMLSNLHDDGLHPSLTDCQGRNNRFPALSLITWKSLIPRSAASMEAYQLRDRIHTKPGSRNGCFVPGANEFYLAIPQRGSQAAGIQVYQVR